MIHFNSKKFRGDDPFRDLKVLFSINTLVISVSTSVSVSVRSPSSHSPLNRNFSIRNSNKHFVFIRNWFVSCLLTPSSSPSCSVFLYEVCVSKWKTSSWHLPPLRNYNSCFSLYHNEFTFLFFSSLTTNLPNFWTVPSGSCRNVLYDGKKKRTIPFSNFLQFVFLPIHKHNTFTYTCILV